MSFSKLSAVARSRSTKPYVALTGRRPTLTKDDCVVTRATKQAEEKPGERAIIVKVMTTDFNVSSAMILQKRTTPFKLREGWHDVMVVKLGVYMVQIPQPVNSTAIFA